MPLKRKDRPESWSSNSCSPDEKKTRENNHRALESENEDDIFKALNMADNLGSKVDLVLNKLKKCDSMELRLENLNKSVANIEESFTIIEKDVEALKENVVILVLYMMPESSEIHPFFQDAEANPDVSFP